MGCRYRSGLRKTLKNLSSNRIRSSFHVGDIVSIFINFETFWPFYSARPPQIATVQDASDVPSPLRSSPPRMLFISADSVSSTRYCSSFSTKRVQRKRLTLKSFGLWLETLFGKNFLFC